MKKLVLIFFLLPMIALAQVEVSVSTPRRNFLLYEAIDLMISLKNTTSNEIVLDNGIQNDTPWLSFVVFSADNRKVEQDNLFLPSSYVLAPNEDRRFVVNITPWYRMRATGPYQIQAAVRLSADQVFMTAPLKINVGSGNVMLEEKRTIEGIRRVYSLISFSDRQQLQLYLRVEAPKKNIVYVTQLLGDYNPSLQIKGPFFDNQQQLHFLYPKSSQLFCYVLADKDGKIISKQDVPFTKQLFQKDNGDVELRSLVKE